METLWPEEIKNSDSFDSPLAILKSQASQLGPLTKNVVKAEVRTQAINPLRQTSSMMFDFNLLAPLLENYRYKLFSTYFDILESYPLKLYLDKKIMNELIGENEEADKNGILVFSQEEFLDWLKRIFNSNSTKNIINTLRASANR